ncbi:MAG: 1-deoxy-D-xylulose-5-phosphate synthase [bacterium]
MKETTLLDRLDVPKDLQRLDQKQLEQVASELRTRLIEIGDACGGHLASNLGVVELTLVLHTLFSTPKDKFVWDTSHQCYVHKLLTGRQELMKTLRQKGGASGFANIFESEHDAFGAGHASTALSAALGMAEAREISKDDYKVVSIFGDAALSGGMAFEALNNIDRLKRNFICILNDNDMSISEPVGAMAHYMTKVRTSPLYNQARKRFVNSVSAIPKVGQPLKRRIEKALDHFREFLLDTKAGVLFEEFGFKYLGPIDGHDIAILMAALSYAKDYNGPILVHILTQKGKGHAAAEADPVKYHGISPKTSTQPLAPKKSYQQVFAETMEEICEKHAKVVAITPAMKGGSGLSHFAQRFPDRFFDVGIAEEHAVTFAAGMARSGIRPVLAIYSTFLQRGYDQLLHDVCLQNLPVIFALDRAGFVGADGATHQGLFDFTYMLPIPNLCILAPKDGAELRMMLHWAIQQQGPVSIRYPKEAIPDQENQTAALPLALQKHECLRDSRPQNKGPLDNLIIAIGASVQPSLSATETLIQEGQQVALINLRCVKPLDRDWLAAYIRKSEQVIVVEEGQAIGGVYSHILQTFQDLGQRRWKSCAVSDTFVEHASIAEQRLSHQLSSKHIQTLAQAQKPV